MGASSTQQVDTSERLAALRDLMNKEPEGGVQALIVPSEDQHSSEYLADCDQRRAFISGFTGSAGCAIVTLKEAFLFTDGRYFLQAEKQLDRNWTLMKQGIPDVPTWQEFLSQKLDSSTRIGVDSTLISASDAQTLGTTLKDKESKLVPLSKNLVDLVWTDRPPHPHKPIFHLEEKYAGQSHAEKIAKVREEITKQKGKALVVTALDEVAWLFNLRGSDIEYNPVFFAYAVVTHDSVTLFVNGSQLEESAQVHLGEIIRVQPYDSFFSFLKELPTQLKLDKESKILIAKSASLAVAEALGQDNITLIRSPVEELKSVKNTVELEGFRQCHIRDGAALAKYFSWLERQLNDGVVLDESQGADKLEEFRSQLDLFRGLSFDTISGAGSNAAIIHYHVNPSDCAVIKKESIYLCDSGGQYTDGTTDVTRTWHFGEPTQEEKRAFTRVLQGHIAIDTAVFPSGTTGFVIDSWARRALWQDGLDYRHGTGHGVGHFLNVHEGPHGIGVRIVYNSAPLKAGMTVSNEPGYYADGKFGIRIENIVLVREVKTPNNFGDKGYLGFENVTFCPMHKNLIDVTLLTADEKKWIDAYHAQTLQKISPLLANDPQTLEWLKKQCLPL